jgi:hypothetical protein
MKRDSAMGEAIALSSPSGHMSKRARRNAEKRLHKLLFEQESEEPEHDDLCKCEDCEIEKAYYINLICSSVDENDEKEEDKMSLPYAINCTNGQGIRQSHSAEGYIISPTGRRISAMCRSCAQVVIDEYKEKLGEIWTFENQEWQEVVPFYIDPIHTAASLLGRKGGLSKSESKSISSCQNGKKGGRPKDELLNVDDI